MPPLIDSVTTAASGGGSVAFSVSAALGSTLVACVGTENATPSISGGPPTWTTRVAAVGGGYPHNVSIFTGPVTSGGSQSLTAGSAGTVSATVYVISSPFVVDSTATGSGTSSTTQAVSGLAVVQTGCLIIGVWGTQYGAPQVAANYSAPAGMTEQSDFRILDFAVHSSCSEVLTTTGSTSRTATVSPAGLGYSAALIALADPPWAISAPPQPYVARRRANLF